MSLARPLQIAAGFVLQWIAVTPMEINRAVGKRLVSRRRELRLSLAQVSDRCGVSLQQIHKYETGQSTLSVPMLVQLSRCLQVRTSYFLQDVEGSVESL
jgi:transcriptional regulator with XRE-family HTH domain